MNRNSLNAPTVQQQELFSFLKNNKEIFFSRMFHSLESPVSLRSLDIETDLTVIHQWVNLDYAKQFWQMNVGLQELSAYYATIMTAPATHSIVAVYKCQLIAQIDLYKATQDVVGKLFQATEYDYGVHFLMAPNQLRIPSLSTIIFSTVIEFLFQCACVKRVIGEPDSSNAKANALVQRIGFRFQKRITLPDKEANLYFCDRSGFIPFH